MRFMYLATASRFASAALVAVTMAATMTAAPAQADSGVDVFLGALNHYRLGDIDPATAVRVGEVAALTDGVPFSFFN